MSSSFPELPALASIKVEGKNILLRADLNLPMADARVSDYTRIDRIIPTLSLLEGKSARRVVLLSHFGRPKIFSESASENPDYKRFSLNHILPDLEKRLNRSVMLLAHGETPSEKPAERGADKMPIYLLENLRFIPGETKNDVEFAKELAKLGDIYVNDAFSVSHRAHASIDALARLLPALAGEGLRKEWLKLNQLLTNPERPLTVIMAGGKISSKLPLLKTLCEKADNLIMGGGMANTVLLGKGFDVGRSWAEEAMAEEASAMLENVRAKILLPEDVRTAPSLDAPPSACLLCDVSVCPAENMILDVGPKTVEAISTLLQKSKTVLVNGPVGVFEHPPFDGASRAIFTKIAELTEQGLVKSVAGGGDTLAALNVFGLKERFSYVSTAGGAFLEWVEGRELPGIAALIKQR